MDEAFKIYIDRLRGGEVERIEESVAPDFLEQNDSELAFDAPIEIQGEAYIAEQELVIHLDLTTTAKVPCSICSEKVEAPVEVNHFYHAEPLDQIKTAVFEMQELLREELLLAAPSIVECEGQCPKRKEIKQYLREDTEHRDHDDNGHRPFAGLNIDL